MDPAGHRPEGSHPSLGKLNELRKISIIDANIHLKDDKKNQEWKLSNVTFFLTVIAGYNAYD